MLEQIYYFSLFLNFLSIVVFFVFAIKKSREAFKIGTFLITLGTFLLILFLTLNGIKLGYHPATNTFFTYNFLAMLIYILYFIFEFWFKIRLLSVFILPVGFFFNVVAAFQSKLTPDVIKSISPVFLGIHTGFLLLGEAMFLVSFGASLMYLIQNRNLKKKSFGGWYSRLPSLQDLEYIAGIGILGGFPMLTAGLLVGFYWAANLWNNSAWFFDPKIIWSLVVWMLYAYVFYCKISEKLKGKRFINLVVLGFIFVILSFFITIFIPSIHSSSNYFGVK